MMTRLTRGIRDGICKAAMRSGLLLVVLAFACGKSDDARPAPAATSDAAPAPAPGSGSGSGSAAGSAAAMTDAKLERLLRDTIDMLDALAGVTGLTCPDKAKQMNLELDKRAAFLAQLHEPKPANEPAIDDRFLEVATRTGLKDRLQVSVLNFEEAILPCSEDADIKKIIDRMQQR